MDTIKLGGIFTVECYDKNGDLKWSDKTHNLVVNEGLDSILDVYFMGDTAHPNFYLGLVSDNPVISAGDTLANHPGWSEVTVYSEGQRQEFVENRSGETVDNQNAMATFSINGSAIIGGSFITSAQTGTTGILLAASQFSNGEKNVSDGDTIKVMYEFRAASS